MNSKYEIQEDLSDESIYENCSDSDWEDPFDYEDEKYMNGYESPIFGSF